MHVKFKLINFVDRIYIVYIFCETLFVVYEPTTNRKINFNIFENGKDS